MPRLYKPDPRGKIYKKYDKSVIQQAVDEYRKSKVSLKIIAEKYNINKSVLYRHSTRTMRNQGGQTVLSEEEEKGMIKYINVCAEWGYPLDSIDLRYLVKSYLDRQGRTVAKFKNNLPGPDFAANFLRRHKDVISQRNCQNIKTNRASVSPDTIRAYFRELEVSLANIEPCNIVNYDETNLTDDPGRKKILTKRGTKYPERVMNHSKASTSVMIAASAAGELLPPYVVYKAQNVYDTWTENGPPGTRYNRSASGWFDLNIFEDWIKTIALPYFRDKDGKKCLIGDNLSSHLSLDVIKLCHEQNITFVFLPANSTHLTQPLDVAFFRPMKIAWRNILLKWKKTDGRKLASVPKGCFPKLLKKLITDLKENSKNNILAGFIKTGIWPINENQVLSRLPGENNNEENKDAIEKSVLDILKEMRYGTMNVTEPKRKRKLDVTPGRSVGTESEDYVDTEEDTFENTNKITAQTTTITCMKTKKGKGRGKKTKRQDQDVNGIEEAKIEVANTDTIPRIEVVDTETIPIVEVADTETIPIVEVADTETIPIIEVADTETIPIIDVADTETIPLIEVADIETMPVLFEDIPFVCEEVEIPPDDICFRENIELIDNAIVHKEAPSKPNRKGKINIIDNKLSQEYFITAKNKIPLQLNPISINTPLNILKTNTDQPSTSGLQIKTKSRRPSYYRNDSEILKDLMSDSD